LAVAAVSDEVDARLSEVVDAGRETLSHVGVGGGGRSAASISGQLSVLARQFSSKRSKPRSVRGAGLADHLLGDPGQLLGAADHSGLVVNKAHVGLHVGDAAVGDARHVAGNRVDDTGDNASLGGQLFERAAQILQRLLGGVARLVNIRVNVDSLGCKK